MLKLSKGPPLPRLHQFLPHVVAIAFLPLVIAKDPRFRDVTRKVGINQIAKSKYGGPVVADLDSDGNYDLFLHYHKGKPDIYFGTSAGTFESPQVARGGDYHGVSIFPRTATTREKLIFCGMGGGGGNSPRLPVVFLSGPDRNLRDISTEFGLGRSKGRGRISMPMDLSLQSKNRRRVNLGGPDILVANFLGRGVPEPSAGTQYAFQNIGGLYRRREVPGFTNEAQGRAELTDIDGDGIMEIISYQEFRIYKLVSPFRFVEAAAEFAPKIEILNFSVNAVVEFDMDNDGDFDLYLARGFENLANNRKIIVRGQEITEFPDILLENRNGKYVDVSKRASIVGVSNSMGVSAGDFNNDGFVDLIVTQLLGPDILLQNNGDGTFKHINPGIPKKGGKSDNTIAVDYDLDGRVDLITGQRVKNPSSNKPINPRAGIYRVMKNVMPLDTSRGYLLVRIGNDPKLASTALHAVVTVLAGTRKQVRRVGSRGSQKAGGGSFIDTVHFGLGSAETVARVTVRWTSGIVSSVQNIQSNQKISIGRFITK